MNYSITTLGKKTIAGFHLVGPRDHTVKQGFEQLMMWVENHRCPPANGWPSTTITRRKCRRKNCAARQRSPWMRIMSFPPTAKGDPAAIAGGDYACARARVVDYDFATPWMQFLTACSRARRIASPPALL